MTKQGKVIGVRGEMNLDLEMNLVVLLECVLLLIFHCNASEKSHTVCAL